MSRLRYIELHQKEMRAKVYYGNILVLPSRYIHQQYLDSISLYQYFGRADLFITMTTNHDWHEIQDILKPSETALDQPDIVSYVFKIKKQQLIKYLSTEIIFGKLLERTHSIEFKKRGFPHIHIIIW